MILVRYIIKEHIFPFIAAFCVITFLFAINQILEILDQVLSKGLPLEVLSEVLVLSLAWMLALSIPMSVLVASLLAFGRLSADHEITAIKAAGISPLFLMRPMLIIGTLVMTFLIVFNNWVLPEANYRAGGLLSSISHKKPSAMLQEGRLVTDFPGVQLWVDHIDQRTGILYGLRIYETPSGSPLRITLADTATLERVDQGATLLLHLKNGTSQYLQDNKSNLWNQIQFARQTLAIANVDDRFERRDRGYRGDREMDVDTMWTIVKDARSQQDSILKPLCKMRDTLAKYLNTKDSNSLHIQMNRFDSIAQWRRADEIQNVKLSKLKDIQERWKEEHRREYQYLVEIHKKFSIPVAAVVFILVGAPLGIMARKGGLGLGVILSLGIFVLFWVCLMGGENLAKRVLMEPWLAMWLPNLLVGPVGIVLCWRMLRDRYSGNSIFRRIAYRIRHLRGRSM